MRTDSIAFTANDNVKHEERGNRVVDEKRENRVVDEEDTKKISSPPEPIDLDHELDKSEMIEKTKRILDKSDIIDQAKIVLAEIQTKGIDHDDMSQKQWNKVEVWESNRTPNNTSPSNQIEEGIDALDWLETDDWSDKEILQEAKNCKLDKITDLESESEEEFFWDSLSQL